MRNKKAFFTGLLVFLLAIGLVLGSCLTRSEEEEGEDSGGTGGGTASGNSTKEKAITVTAGYSATCTISTSGENWFKFIGTGDPIIFETEGDIVDTNIDVDDGSWWGAGWSDNDGDGNNALVSLTSQVGTTYLIKITAKNGTKGAYTFVVKEPTSNLRSNPINVSVGNSSSHTIYKDGTHWFRFSGTGDRVFFESEGNVVRTEITIYVGDTNDVASCKKLDNTGINFFTVVGTTYYIKITGNSGTYTFIVRNGTGDGSSAYNAIEVTTGYSSSRNITSSGKHYFMYKGTGNNVTFKTSGSVVDTFINVDDNSWWGAGSSDNDGDGNNALVTVLTTSGKSYWIEVSARSSTSGTYTFIVE